MKNYYLGKSVVLTALLMFALVSVASGATADAQKIAYQQLLTSNPEVQFYRENSTITRIYGQAFIHGISPQDAAEQFRTQYSPILGVDPGDLQPVSYVVKDGNTLQLMYENGKYKFTLVYYSQYKDGIPVYKSDLRLLVRNESGYPLVLAASALKDLGNFTVDAGKASVDPKAAQDAFAIKNPQYVKFTDPQRVIWAGIDDKVNPAVGIEFIADDGNEPTVLRDLYIIDPVSGEVLYQENQVVDINVSGQVTGLATENFLAEQCGNEVTTPLKWARVKISGGDSTFTDSLGNFTINNSGSSSVTVLSQVRGHWFYTHDQAVSDTTISRVVTPPGPANFQHNPANAEYRRAEVNAYLHANVVRDFTLKYVPNYPTVATQTNFPVYVNDNTGYCPGNAWYDGVSLTFCRSGGGYRNTAFSTVVHHEYGHHLVECAGSGQGQYGEGMGDVMGLLITDDPGAAYGFYGDGQCAVPLRNADNTLQYPCSGEIHDCGQLLSGCVWSTRNALAATHPTNYIDILAPLAISAMTLHSGTEITPQITIDYLTLDDDDGNINNGTPHHSEICAGFTAHNMDCPALNLLSFAYPNGRPTFISPNGGTSMRVVVTAIGATPQANTGVLHYNAGAGWLTSNMTQVTPNVYDAVFPALTCGISVHYYCSALTTTGTLVTDPQNAPSVYYSTQVGTADRDTLFTDDFSTNQGWTGTGGLGEWTIGVATGGSGSDGYGGPDPATDHSSTSDNRLLGNDITSGTGGDYSASLTQTNWVTSPIYNLSGRYAITVSFWRWLGVEQNIYDHAYFQVKNASGTWVTLFENGGTTIDESAWSQYSYDVSDYATNNPNFQIQFGIGATDDSWQFCGWNIDDIVISAMRCNTTPPGTLSGTVTDFRGAINQAFVHAVNGGTNFYDTTSTSGAYSMSLPPATYNVTFTKSGERDTTISGVVITSSNTTTLNVVMQRLPGTISGTVTRYPSSPPTNPIANVFVSIVGSSRLDTTNSSGAYSFANVVDSTYTLRFTNSDYRDTTIAGIVVTAGGTTTRNVQMVILPGYINGTVRDTTGAPLQNIFVRINTGALLIDAAGVAPANGGSTPIIAAVDSMYTDVNGYYSSQRTVGTYNVRFTHTDYRDTTIHSVVVTAADTTNVSPVLKRRNRAPVITSPATASATEDILFRYTATASDSDATVPTLAFSNYPAWMSVLGDTIQGTPLNGNGNTTFRIIASDGFLADTQTVSVTVIPVNDPPVITSPIADTATERILFTYHATATDPDNTPTCSFINYPSWLQVSGAIIFGTPGESFHDTTFWVIASDGQLADTEIVAVAIIDINDPPVITSSSTAEAHEDQHFSYVATAQDPEGLTPTISLSNYAAWLSVVGDTISGTPDSTTTNSTFRIIASDGVFADTQIVTLTITFDNHYPQVTSAATATATEREQFQYTASAIDPDGTTPQITFFRIPHWLTVAGHIISGTPGESYPDTSFGIIASDGQLADTLMVSLNVIDINDPPVITSPSADTATVGLPFDYQAAASDPEGTTPIISFAEYPTWMEPSGMHLSGTPNPGSSSSTFKVIASDGVLAETLIVDLTVLGGCDYVTGDVNGSGVFNGLDVTYGVGYFKGGAPPLYSCECTPGNTWYVSGDVNNSCSFNGLDVTFMVSFFKGGSIPTSCLDCLPSGILDKGLGHNISPRVLPQTR